MTIKEWTKYLAETYVTKNSADNLETFLPCSAEAAAVDTNWSECWRRCGLSGLGSELTTFNFKLLHRLLVTTPRLFDLGRRNSLACSLCAFESEDLAHTLLLCPYNQTIGVKISSIVKKYLPGSTNDMILRLEFNDLQEETEFSLTFFTSVILGDMYVNYSAALEMTGLQTLFDRREDRCLSFAKKCTKIPLGNRLFPLNQVENGRAALSREKYPVNFARTDSYWKSAVPFCQRLLNQHFIAK